MKVAVLIKQVPKGDAKMDKQTGNLSRENGVTTNPYDFFALEAALRLKDKYNAIVDAFSMAPLSCMDNFKQYYSLGVDNCYLISDRAFGGADVYATSYTIASAIKATDNYDIILCGRQTTDGDTSAVGAQIAEKLAIPSVMYTKEIIDVIDNKVTVVRELTSNIEKLSVTMPCLIYMDKDTVIPRLPTLKGKLMASKKQGKLINLSNLDNKDTNNYGSLGSKTKVVKVYEEVPLQKGVQVKENIKDFIISSCNNAKRTSIK